MMYDINMFFYLISKYITYTTMDSSDEIRKINKYEKKYNDLLTLINKNITSRYIICLLWFNKNRTEIGQIGPDSNDLNIKNNIVQTYNIFKEKYHNPKVVLFLNYDKIIDSDFEFFRTYNVETENINLFRTINETEHLKRLFDMNINNEINQPKTYIYVDMLKVIIQYEKMVYDDYEYVFFFDLDIQDKDNIDQNNIICSKGQLNYVDEYFPENLFNEHNLELLDTFGYLYAGNMIVKQLKSSEIDNLKSDNELEKKLKNGEIVRIYEWYDSETNEILNDNDIKIRKATMYDFEYAKSMYSIVKYYYSGNLSSEIDGENIKRYMTNNLLNDKIKNGIINIIDGIYYQITKSNFGENSVLISKNDPLVITAIRDYFIDYVFNDQNDDITRYTNNRIWRSYKFFYMYLNYLKGYVLLSYKLSQEEFVIFKNLNFREITFEEFANGEIGDYWCDIKSFNVKVSKKNKTNKNHVITMISKNCTDYFIKTYGYDCVWFNFYFTELGKNIYKKYQHFLGNFDRFMIEPRFMTNSIDFMEFQNISNLSLIPFSCFPIGKQKNSVPGINESGKVNGCKYSMHSNIFDETSVIVS